MICRYRDPDGKCLNAEENIMCKKYPSERYCQIMCNFRETDKEGAREWVLGCIHHDGFVETKRGDIANQVIKEALEKRKPKKPSRADAYPHRLYCTNCGWTFFFSENSKTEGMFSYCPECGQAIDWSEEE